MKKNYKGIENTKIMIHKAHKKNALSYNGAQRKTNSGGCIKNHPSTQPQSG